MDRNAFLAFALSFLVLSLWMTWEAKQRPVQPPAAAAAQVAEQSTREASRSAPVPATEPTLEPGITAATERSAPEQLVEIENGAVHATLTTRGAGIRHLELLRYRRPRSEGGGPVVMIDRSSGESAAFMTPLGEIGLGNGADVGYRVASQGPDEAVFEYTQNGVRVRKTFSFEDGSYRFRIRIEVANGGQAVVSPAFGVELPTVADPSSDFTDLTLATLATGSVQHELLKSFGGPGFLGRESAKEREFVGDIEWAGAYSHYFVSAILPDSPREVRAHWSALVPGHEALIHVDHPPAAVLAGTALDREYVAYVGPKEPELLAAAGNQLERSINLGWSWIAPITRAFSWLLKACYQILPNYGIAIIVLTALVRLATSPLATRQMRSMRRMGELQPKIKELQEKYGDDRQQQSQEMMKLYREAGVNPLGGCLPLLLQFPVLIGLYYALQSSIDLRQAPFGLWIDDLSRPETLFTIPGVLWPVRLLPILMTLSMVIQQRMTPTTTTDPVQARTMMVVMPVMFFFMFYGFPSGLVLYWFVSNLLAIAQQTWLNHQMSPRPA